MITPRILVTLLASTILAPSTALAQSENPCEELLRALPQDSQLTREQVEEYRVNNNLEACQTALSEIRASGDEGQAIDRADAAADTAQPADGRITVEGGAPNIQVQQAAPQITIEQPQSQVTVQQGQPQIMVRQPAPIISIEIPAPEITFSMPTPRVDVNTPEPQVSVQQADPEVHVVTAPDNAEAAVQAQSEQPQPIIQYQAEEAQVTINQADEPVVRFEQQAAGADQEQPPTDADQAGMQDPPATEDQAGAQDIASAEDATASETSGTTDQNVDAGEQLQVARLQGMQVMGPNGQESIGTVTAVIMDARQRPFVIVNRGADEVAVMVEQAERRGEVLVLDDIDPATLPLWDPTSPDAANMEELPGSQEISVRGSSS